MLGLRRQSQTEKVKDALREAVSRTDELVHDRRLFADLRSAVGHGAAATYRVRKDVKAGGVTSRLVSDRRLRRNVRALLDDLESAGKRVRRKRSHRVRNVLFVIAGTGAAVAFVPSARHWVAGQMSENGRMSADPMLA